MNEPTPPGPPPPHGSPQPQTEGLAIASMVCGIVGFVSCGLTGIAAAILGHKANRKIARSNGALGGSGFATAGLITGYISIVVGGILGLAGVSGLVAPVILRQKKAAERMEMTSNMRVLGLSFLEFEMEFGAFPSDATAAAVKDTTGTSFSVAEMSGEGVVKQLEAFGISDVDQFLRVSRLAKGDWWYFQGHSTEAPPRQVLLVSPSLDGERVVLRVDNSVTRTPEGGVESLVEELGQPIVIPAPRKGGGS